MARSNRPVVSADRLDALLGRLQLTGIRGCEPKWCN